MYELLTENEVAAWLRVTPAKLQRDRWKGVGAPFVRVGRAVRYVREAVEAWLQAHAVGGAA